MKRTLLITIASLLVASLSGFAAAAPQTLSNAPFKRIIKNGTSSNWSGYASLTNLKSPAQNAVSFVGGTWTVPKVTCSFSTTYSSMWVGIDGYSDNTVEQTGTEQNCSRGRAQYYTWYEMYPNAMIETNLAVAPGNSVTASVQFSGTSTYTLNLVNNTTGQKYKTIQNLNGAGRESAEWIAEAPSSYFGVLPLANFGTVQFSGANATINGVNGSINNTGWQDDNIQMLANINTPKAVPSSLQNNGTGFTVQWKHS